jgi:hypothetical protein
MIVRELTNTYLSSFNLLTEALYLCWSNSFCYETNTLDKGELKEQIRSYGFYDYKHAYRKEVPINFTNNFEFKTLVWVNKFSNAVSPNQQCEYIELHKQVIDEVENNLFLLRSKDERIAYANILLRNFDKGHIHRRKLDVTERNRLYKETFEVILDREFLFNDGVAIQDNHSPIAYPNYTLTAQLINHLNFIDKLIELFSCFEIDLIHLAAKFKLNLYIFDVDKSEIEGKGEPDSTIDNSPGLMEKNNFKDSTLPKFTSSLSDDCLVKIMHYLSNKNKLIEANTDTWLFWFNRKYIKVPEPLKWNSSPTLLSNIIQQLCGESISTIVKKAFCTKVYVKPTKSKYGRSRMHKEIEQIIIISKQKNN